MILLLCATVVIVILTIVAIIRSDKPIKLILAEAKYDLIFYSLGSQNIMQDWLMKRQNKTDLPLSSGKVALITGGTRGIGLQVVKMLLKCDIKVIIGCRNVQMAQLMLEKFRNEGISSGSFEAFPLDISVIKSVQTFANIVKKKYEKIHYLINCAGIMHSPAYIETRDGFESLFATNYLGHFLLTHLLLPNIKAAGDDKCNARIINVSSCAYLAGDIKFDDINNRDMYVTLESYAQSKLAQLLFSNYLDALLRVDNVPIQLHSVHPGLVDTDLFEGHLFKKISPWAVKLFFKTPEEGAMSIIYACLSPALEGKGATYITNCAITDVNNKAKCEELQKKLFDFTMKLLKIDRFGVTQ